MISTKNNTYLPLSKDNILKYISDEDIFRKYIKYNFKIDEIFSAPYRIDDHPSFGIYWNSHYQKLMFKDLSSTADLIFLFNLSLFLLLADKLLPFLIILLWSNAN